MHYAWVALAIITVKSFISPGWPSSLEFVFACGLVALVLWIESRPKPMSVTEHKAFKDLSTLHEEVESTRREFVALKMKLGFRPER